MNTDRWMKMQRNVSLASYVMIGSFWLAISLPEFWWLGLLMMAHQGQNFWTRMKVDTADERAELIAARAGFLSQKLMLGTGILALALGSRVPGDWGLIGVLLVGSFSEQAFRKWLGAEPVPQSSLGRVVLSAIGVFAVACGVWVGVALWRGWL